MPNQSQRVTDLLGITYPIVQAPMNWVTNASLVAAVSNAGGLGVLGPNAGQHQGYSPEETYTKMREEIQKTKHLTDKPFGINILLPNNPFTQALLDAGLDEGVAVFVTVGDADPEVFEKIKAAGKRILHRPLEPTSQAMQEAERLGADALVATGYDEGGVIPARPIGTFTIVPAMVDAVSIPVLAAGGINDRRGVQAAYALGASGVYMGSRFLMTQESPMAENVKEALLSAKNEDMLLVAKQQRSLATAFARELEDDYTSEKASQTNTQIIRERGGVRAGMLEGDLINGIISMNTGIEIIQDIPTVQELIRDLMA